MREIAVFIYQGFWGIERKKVKVIEKQHTNCKNTQAGSKQTTHGNI